MKQTFTKRKPSFSFKNIMAPMGWAILLSFLYNLFIFTERFFRLFSIVDRIYDSFGNGLRGWFILDLYQGLES